MNRIFLVILIAAFLLACNDHEINEGLINVPDALLTYKAEGKGLQVNELYYSYFLVFGLQHFSLNHQLLR